MFLSYTNLLGGIALAIEATLPLPQLLSNWKRGGCKGFRVSVIVNWIIGDTFKMWFFFASDSSAVPIAFKACGIFQALCDLGLGLQFFIYGNGPPEGVLGEKGVLGNVPELSEKPYGVDVKGEGWGR
jgi:solute carrier family 66, member 2